MLSLCYSLSAMLGPAYYLIDLFDFKDASQEQYVSYSYLFTFPFPFTLSLSLSLSLSPFPFASAAYSVMLHVLA